MFSNEDADTLLFMNINEILHPIRRKIKFYNRFSGIKNDRKLTMAHYSKVWRQLLENHKRSDTLCYTIIKFDIIALIWYQNHKNPFTFDLPHLRLKLVGRTFVSRTCLMSAIVEQTERAEVRKSIDNHRFIGICVF